VKFQVDKPVRLSLSLSATNLWDLPIKGAVKNASILTLDRHANGWIDNALVLSECDPGMLNSNGLRGVGVGAMGRVRFINGTFGAEETCPVVIDHPTYGPSTVGSGDCKAAASDWRLMANGWVMRANSTSNGRGNSTQLCIAYSINTTSQPLESKPCSNPGPGWRVQWRRLGEKVPSDRIDPQQYSY
jgi:hypothetical protein